MSEVCHFEDFELDPSAYRLSRRGEVVRLERIPLELLRLLVERREQIVSRDEILERIWGKGVFIDSENAINTAVRKVRRALQDDADNPRFIVTIPGRGYRFVAPVIANGEADDKNSIRTGSFCSYLQHPRPPISWQLEEDSAGELATSRSVHLRNETALIPPPLSRFVFVGREAEQAMLRQALE